MVPLSMQVFIHVNNKDLVSAFNFCTVVARAYLKSVAKKLADDVDNLKTSANSLGKVWVMFMCYIFPFDHTLPNLFFCSKSKSGWSVGP